jgi:hypothetical protein
MFAVAASGADQMTTQTTIALKRIRLNLARSKDFPNGSNRHGYEIVAPLDDTGHIDPVVWKNHRSQCRVKRIWEGEETDAGLLVHKPGGTEHARWIFDYNPEEQIDDEAGYRFESHIFVPDEYVSIRGADGNMHTFVVASVTNLPS